MICRLQVIRISSEQLLKDYPHQRQAISWNLTDSKAKKKNSCNAKMLPLLLFKNFNVLSSKVVSATETSWWSWLGIFFCKAEATTVANHLLAARETYLKSRLLLLIFVSAAVAPIRIPALLWQPAMTHCCFIFWWLFKNWGTCFGVNRFFEKFRNHKTLFFDRPEKNSESISLLCATSSRH